jgi:hypothetical protein
MVCCGANGLLTCAVRKTFLSHDLEGVEYASLRKLAPGRLTCLVSSVPYRLASRDCSDEINRVQDYPSFPVVNHSIPIDIASAAIRG